ncbi:hypothetical protein HN358_03580 [Candidatus Uhrbacteria bacterium]|jgi:hypothetical protein|nr:hypothetical protein [Candidatus Uhrbacteria bacterium]MBT7717217.1 hypothetical protein [Candidatus Uhrbacteria bacterium]
MVRRSFKSWVTMTQIPDFETLVFAAYSGLRGETRGVYIGTDRGHYRVCITGIMKWQQDGKSHFKFFGRLPREHSSLSTLRCHYHQQRFAYEIGQMLDPANVMALVRYEMHELAESLNLSVEYVAVVSFGRLDMITASMIYARNSDIVLEILEPMHPLGRWFTVRTIGFFHDRREGQDDRIGWIGLAHIDDSWRLAYANVHESGLATIRILPA